MCARTGEGNLSIELQVLIWSVVLGFIHVIASSHTASLQRGYRWAASARDERPPELTGIAGRLDRALRNYLETYPFFAALVLAAQFAHVHNALTVWGAGLYIGGRVVYLPLYAFGVYLVRSLAWNVAAIGIFLFVIALLRF
jgi:uncharacterized MAPEG superfamily protein